MTGASLMSNAKNLTPHKWTVMVYMAGDRFLDNNGFADLKEMKNIGSTSEVALLAQFNRGMPRRRTKRYVLRRDNRDGTLADDVVEDLGETRGADPEALVRFIHWGVTNFQAQRYLLVLWGHGNGADDENIAGQASHASYSNPDEPTTHANAQARLRVTKGLRSKPARGIAIGHVAALETDAVDFLDAGKFKQALDTAKKIIGHEVDVLGMDACLMSGAEVCYQLRGSARYTVAPEGVAPLDGWPYDKILRELVAQPAMEPARLACLIAEKYLASYADYEDVCVTQAVCDLSKSAKLARTVDR